MMRRMIVGIGLVAFGLTFLTDWALAQQPSVTLRLGLAVPGAYPYTTGARYLADTVRERTNGRVKIDVFPDAVLGNEVVEFEQVKAGGLDMAVTPPGVVGLHSKEMELWELPFLFKDLAHRNAVTEGPIGRLYAENMEKKLGVVVLGYFGGSVREILCKSKPINSIDDFQGVKTRIQPSPILINSWKAIGVVPVVLPYPEVYLALQTGVVECADNEPVTFTMAKWAETAKHMILTHHMVTVRYLIINAKNLAKLSSIDQEILRTAAREATTYEVNLEVRQDKEARDQLVSKYGVKLFTPDRKPFVDRSEPVRQEFAKSAGIEAVLKEISSQAK
jgi:tripartite ATP-independent transporter DctP family solute receptor